MTIEKYDPMQQDTRWTEQDPPKLSVCDFHGHLNALTDLTADGVYNRQEREERQAAVSQILAELARAVRTTPEERQGTVQPLPLGPVPEDVLYAAGDVCDALGKEGLRNAIRKAGGDDFLAMLERLEDALYYWDSRPGGPLNADNEDLPHYLGRLDRK